MRLSAASNDFCGLIRLLDLQQLLQRDGSIPPLLLVTESERLEIMLSQCRREDQFGIRLVLDESRRRESLDRLIVSAVARTIGSFSTASAIRTIHATASPAVCFRFRARADGIESLSRV